MSSGGAVAAIIAAVIIKRRRDLAALFEKKGATSSKKAITLDSDDFILSGYRVSERNIGQYSFIKRVGENKFHLDKEEYEKSTKQAQSFMLFALILGLALLTLILLFK